MKPYLAVISARFRQLLQYRFAAIAGITTQLFWGYLHVMVFIAFYEQVGTSLPLTLEQAISYTWLVQSFLLLLPWNIDRDVEYMVRKGAVAYELIRPVDLYALWFARAFAWRAAPLPMRTLPILLIGYAFLGLQLPESPVAAVLFSVSMILSLFLGTAITVIMMISIFWTLTTNGIVRLISGLVVALSGMLIPIPFYPDWMQPWLYALPFRGLFDTPFRFYLGEISLEAAWFPLLHQLGWIAVMLFYGKWLLQRAQKKIVIQGG